MNLRTLTINLILISFACPLLDAQQQSFTTRTLQWIKRHQGWCIGGVAAVGAGLLFWQQHKKITLQDRDINNLIAQVKVLQQQQEKAAASDRAAFDKQAQDAVAQALSVQRQALQQQTQEAQQELEKLSQAFVQWSKKIGQAEHNYKLRAQGYEQGIQQLEAICNGLDGRVRGFSQEAHQADSNIKDMQGFLEVLNKEYKQKQDALITRYLAAANTLVTTYTQTTESFNKRYTQDQEACAAHIQQLRLQTTQHAQREQDKALAALQEAQNKYLAGLTACCQQELRPVITGLEEQLRTVNTRTAEMQTRLESFEKYIGERLTKLRQSLKKGSAIPNEDHLSGSTAQLMVSVPAATLAAAAAPAELASPDIDPMAVLRATVSDTVDARLAALQPHCVASATQTEPISPTAFTPTNTGPNCRHQYLADVALQANHGRHHSFS